MSQITRCHYCRQEIKGKPFIPVHSNLPYHWKCYINKIKDEKAPAEVVEEVEEPKTEIEEP